LAKVAEDPSRCVPPLFVGRFFFLLGSFMFPLGVGLDCTPHAHPNPQTLPPHSAPRQVR
jgi:hypothetical protein